MAYLLEPKNKSFENSSASDSTIKDITIYGAVRNLSSQLFWYGEGPVPSTMANPRINSF